MSLLKKDIEPAVAVYRVLSALIQLQKDSNENAFRLEDIRKQAQMDSRTSASQFGRVGRGWILSFNKALDRMEKVRILRNVTLETVAFTENATMVLSNSAHLPSIPNSSSEDENYYWQELIGFARGDPPIRLVAQQQSPSSPDKRSISENSFPNKRAKVSARPKKKVTLSEAPKRKGKQPETSKKRGRAKKIQLEMEAPALAEEDAHYRQVKSAPPDPGDDEVEVDIENDDDDDYDDETDDGEINESEEETEYMQRVTSATRDGTRQSEVSDERNGPDVPHHTVSSSSQRPAINPKRAAVNPNNSSPFYEGIIHLSSGSYTLLSPGQHIVRHPAPQPPFPRSPLRETYVDDTTHNGTNAQPHNYNHNFDVDSVRDQGWSRQSHHVSPTLPDQRRTNNSNNYLYQSPGFEGRTGPRYGQSPALSVTPKGNGDLPARTQATSHSEIKSLRKPSGESAVMAVAAVAAGQRAISMSTSEGATSSSGMLSLSSSSSTFQGGGAKSAGHGHGGGGENAFSLTSEPGRFSRLETLAIVSQRNEFISALEDAKEKLGAELSEVRRSCERAERTVVRTTQQLQEAVREVNGLKRERAYTLDRLRYVKKMNEEARAERDLLVKEVGKVKEWEAELESRNARSEGRINDLVRELEEMKRASLELERERDKERTSPIDNMNDIDSNDPSHAFLRRNNDNDHDDDDDDLERTPTVSKSRTVVNERGISVGVQSLGNESHSRDHNAMGESAESSLFSARLIQTAAKGDAYYNTPKTTSAALLTKDDNGPIPSSLGAESFEETLETTPDYQISQSERVPPAAGTRFFNNIVAAQLENAGKRELEILTGLGEKISILMSALTAQKEANRALQDEAQATRALFIELEQTDRGQMPALSSSRFEGALRSAKADMEDISMRLAKGDVERGEIKLQLAKTQGEMDKLGDFLSGEVERNATLAAQLEESLGKTRSLEDELEYYRNLQGINPEDIHAVYKSFTAFKLSQMNALKNLGLRVNQLAPTRGNP